MSKTREILLARRRDIETEAAPILAELAEIDAALKALGVTPKNVVSRGVSQPTSSSKLSGEKQVLHTLKEHPEGLSTARPGVELNLRFRRVIAPRNLSWYCSRLKSRGSLLLDGERWKLPS